MARFHQTLLIPSNELQTIQRYLQDTHTHVEHGEAIYSGTEARFTNSFVLTVAIINNDGPVIRAQLFDQVGIVVREHEYHGDIVQDYVFEVGRDTYELSIRPGAATELTSRAIKQFNEQKGTACPYCESADLHKALPHWVESDLLVQYSCLECEAEWHVTYAFQQLLNDPERLTPPTRNVMQNGHR